MKEIDCLNLKCPLRDDFDKKKKEYEELDVEYRKKIEIIERLEQQLNDKEDKTDNDKLVLENTKLTREKDISEQELKRVSEMNISLQAKTKVLNEELKKKDVEFSEIKTDIDLSDEVQELKEEIKKLRNEATGMRFKKGKLKRILDQLDARKVQDTKDLEEIQKLFNDRLREYKKLEKEKPKVKDLQLKPKQIIIKDKASFPDMLKAFWWFVLIWFVCGIILGVVVPMIIRQVRG